MAWTTAFSSCIDTESKDRSQLSHGVQQDITYLRAIPMVSLVLAPIFSGFVLPSLYDALPCRICV